MREQSLFQSAEKNQRELEALGGVEAHERDLGALVVVVCVCDERGVVQELVERFATIP